MLFLTQRYGNAPEFRFKKTAFSHLDDLGSAGGQLRLPD